MAGPRLALPLAFTKTVRRARNQQVIEAGAAECRARRPRHGHVELEVDAPSRAVASDAPAAPLGIPEIIRGVDAAAVRLRVRARRRELAPVRELGAAGVEVERPDRALGRIGEIHGVAGAVPAEAVRYAKAAELRRGGSAVQAVERSAHRVARGVRRDFGLHHRAAPEAALTVDAAVVETRADVGGLGSCQPFALAACDVVPREAGREGRDDDVRGVGQRERAEAFRKLEAVRLPRTPAIAIKPGRVDVGPPHGLSRCVPQHAFAEHVADLEHLRELRVHALCRRSAGWASSFCSATNASTSAPMTIFVHQLLSWPLKEMYVWIKPMSSTPSNVPTMLP